MKYSQPFLTAHNFLSTLLITSLTSMMLFINSAQAETLTDFLNDTSGTWEIQINTVTDGGCDGTNGNLCSSFVFGSPVGVTTGPPAGLVDNEDAGDTIIGPSGLGGDGLAGFISIKKTSSNNFIVTTYLLDSYLATAGGTKATRMVDVSAASGTISSDGTMTLDLTGRTAALQFFPTFGEQEWNRDNSTTIGGAATGVFELFTTGQSTNIDPINPPSPNETIFGRNVGDLDSDGVLDAILVSAGNVGDAWGPFTGTPYAEVYNIKLVRGGTEPIPKIVVDIIVPAGSTQECSEEGGSNVELATDIRLINGAELSTVEWFIDGVSSGFGETFTPFLDLGAHTIQASATTVQGPTDSDTVDVNIQDTTPPVLDLGFINTLTGEPVTEISSSAVQFVTTQMSATDICDPMPLIQAAVTPVYAVEDGDVILIRPGKFGNKLGLDTTALELRATATDSSNRGTTVSAILHVIE